MTLKITRFFQDALNKQAKISHFNFPIKFNVPEKISSEWKEQIKEQFGELFLNDANYVVACQIVPAAASADDDDEDKKTTQFNDKDIQKFTDLLTTVFGTEVPKSDAKKLDPNYVIVKITTK